MMDSTDIRDEIYTKFIKNDSLTSMQMAVLRVLREIQPATSQSVASHMQVEINQVTGRIRELVEEGIVVQSGKVWNEVTNAWRTEWRLTKPEEQSTQKLNKSFCLSNSEMNRIETMLRKANEFQKEKIREMLN